MKVQLDKLIEWHKSFQVPYKETFDYEPLTEDEIQLRSRIMIEEVKEWAADAKNEAQVHERAKELADILYTVFGTIITEGLQDVIEQAFDAVHASNMSKLNNDGTPFKRADGKVLKGERYIDADMSFLDGYVKYD